MISLAKNFHKLLSTTVLQQKSQSLNAMFASVPLKGSCLQSEFPIFTKIVKKCLCSESEKGKGQSC